MPKKQDPAVLQKDADLKAAKSDARIALMNHDMPLAERSMHKFWDKYYPKRGDFLLKATDQTIYLLDRSYEDLPFSDDIRRAIGAEIALSVLNGQGPGGELTRAILEVTGGQFSCPALEEFLRNDPCGYCAPETIDEHDIDPDEELPRDTRFDAGAQAYVYSTTACGEAFTERDRFQLLNGVAEGTIAGVEILKGVNECHICHVDKLIYPADQIDHLPKLPRHWACSCCYSAWFGN
jgi:hypothetical protein